MSPPSLDPPTRRIHRVISGVGTSRYKLSVEIYYLP